ncbi:histidine phosphatase family protein [Winogradskya humida]|uniref:Phosphoglycerate mutase n=1 Tax=Winogradskya humida TaxID=113566 RepID=A0ABQ3ZHK7_9ACTN|nr:histidine phosphatase family protein [Actinoplanes humidus]GIE17999.1 phosphoglycerate mutase [Actinoplanes humidus]
MSGLRLLACAPTAALRGARFGGDEDLDEGGRKAALALSAFGRGDMWVCAPSRASCETAQALGHTAATEPDLADPDFGRWNGKSLDEVALADPDALKQWLTDPGAAPHGGESLVQIRHRAGEWVDSMARHRVVAVAHPIVVRAALTHALGLPDERLWSLDVAPLSLTRLMWRSGRWNLHFPAA